MIRFLYLIRDPYCSLTSAWRRFHKQSKMRINLYYSQQFYTELLLWMDKSLRSYQCSKVFIIKTAYDTFMFAAFHAYVDPSERKESRFFFFFFFFGKQFCWDLCGFDPVVEIYIFFFSFYSTIFSHTKESSVTGHFIYVHCYSCT